MFPQSDQDVADLLSCRGFCGKMTLTAANVSSQRAGNKIRKPKTRKSLIPPVVNHFT